MTKHYFSVYFILILLIGGEKMPNVFKALASIAAWVLFIGGLIGILVTSISASINIGLVSPPDLAHSLGWILSSVQVTLAVVIMILRKKME